MSRLQSAMPYLAPPPPEYAPLDQGGADQAQQYAIFHAHVASSASNPPPTLFLYVFDVRQRKWAYIVRIPKKREGWKAEVCSVTEKHREEPRYEVRREPLSRKFDLRPPNGIHNVLIPAKHSSGSKSFSIEASDGQMLSWRKDHSKLVTLLSMPSKTVMAQYRAFDPASASSTSIVPHTSEYGTQAVALLGTMTVAATACVKVDDTILSYRQIKRSNSAQSAASSSSSEAGPRLHKPHRNAQIGVCAPLVTAAAIGSPYVAAALNGSCVIRDELSNLGKTQITTSGRRTGESVPPYRGGNGSSPPRSDHEWTSQAEYWASQNRTPASRSDDPRPRYIELDLIIASLSAVLVG